MSERVGGDAALGAALRLMLRSDVHCRWLIRDLERLLLPPIRLKQIRFYGAGGETVAFVTWAWLSEQAAEGFASGRKRLAAEDWRSGGQLWLVDLVAPYGHLRSVARDLRHNVFPGETAWSVRRRPDGSIRKRNFWWGEQKDRNRQAAAAP